MRASLFIIVPLLLSSCIPPDPIARVDAGGDAITADHTPGTCPSRELGSALGPAVATGTTVGGTDALHSTGCGVTNAPEATFGWTAPSSGRFTFDTRGSALDTVLYVREGSCTGADLGCNDDVMGVGPSSVTVALTAGQRVVVVVDGYGTTTGAYQLNITGAVTPPPTCPMRSLASALGLAVATGTTAGGTDALHSTGCGVTSAPEATFGWTSPFAGTFTFDTRGSTLDTVLYVRDGDCTGADLGCNDDVMGIVPSSVTVPLRAGQLVVIVVDGYGTRTGDYQLNISGEVPMPVPCTTRDLGSAVGLAVATGTTAGGTDALHSTGCGVTNAPEAAFTWTAPSSGAFIIDTRGSALDTVLYVRDGDCSGPDLGCNDDTAGVFTSVVTVRLTAGHRVVIVVNGFGTTTGAYQLNIASAP